MKAIFRLLFAFFLFINCSIHARVKLELDGVEIIIEEPEYRFELVMLPHEQAILPASSFSVEYERSNPVIISHTGRTSFNQHLAATSYEQFREQWMNDSWETMFHMKIDHEFRNNVIQRLNNSFNHLLQTNSPHIYDRILARLSLAQAVMQEEPYHTNIAHTVYKLQHRFFDNDGKLRCINPKSEVVDAINECSKDCGIKFTASGKCPEDNPLIAFAKKAKTFFCVWGNLDKRIALNATNKAIINCLQACKQLDFAKAKQIARTSSDSLLLQRIIDQYKQEVDEALYDADGIYQLAKDDPIFKQLTPAARKQLKKNEQQRNTLNTHLRSRAAIKNSLMERWHIDQSAPPSVHRALYELMDDQHSKHTPYAITKIATIANSPETIKAFYLPNGVLKGFEQYAGARLIPASAHLLTPEAALLRVMLNQAVYEHHEHKTALANAMLQTMSQLINDINTYGPLFGTQWPQLPKEPLIDDVESIYDCIDNIRRMGYPHLAHTLNTMCEYSEGFKDGAQERTRDVSSYVCEHPIRSTALVGSAAVCCYAVSAFPLAMGSLKLLAAGESFASLTKPSAATNSYERGKEHAHCALDMFSQYVVGKAGAKVLKKFSSCYRYSHELASRLFDKLERALSNGGLEPIDATYQPILALPELANATEMIAPEPLPQVPPAAPSSLSEISIFNEPFIDTTSIAIQQKTAELTQTLKEITKKKEIEEQEILEVFPRDYVIAQKLLENKIHVLELEYPPVVIQEALQLFKTTEKELIKNIDTPAFLEKTTKILHEANGNPRWKTFKYDPDKGNEISLGSVIETEAAIACEKQGLLENLQRAPCGDDFIQSFAYGKKYWDVKSPQSYGLNKCHVFNLNKFIDRLKRKLNETSSEIILNITYLNDQDTFQLYQEIFITLKDYLARFIVIHVNDTNKSMNNSQFVNFLINNGF